jgi:hypothetical protein
MARKSLSCCVRTTTRRSSGCRMPSAWSANPDLEQRVLHFLIKGTCPIIIVLARQMYKRVPDELQPLPDNGRLLIISTTPASRQSRTTAYARNHYICELVDKIIMVGVNEGSSLVPLKENFSNKLHSIISPTTCSTMKSSLLTQKHQ